MVEGREFQELMEYCEPQYTVPSWKHISKLFDRYTSVKSLLTNKLRSDAFSLSLTTDTWTTSSMEAYISLTCHFLTSQWEFVDCVFATRTFHDHHTGNKISSTIKEIPVEISDRIVSCIVHDQGSNVRWATYLLQIEKGSAGVNCSGSHPATLHW